MTLNSFRIIQFSRFPLDTISFEGIASCCYVKATQVHRVSHNKYNLGPHGVWWLNACSDNMRQEKPIVQSLLSLLLAGPCSCPEQFPTPQTLPASVSSPTLWQTWITPFGADRTFQESPRSKFHACSKCFSWNCSVSDMDTQTSSGTESRA